MSKKIIIIPAYNEEKNILHVLNEIKNIPFLNDFDIIVIDDGSADNTNTIVKSLNIPLISLPTNLGYGVAVQTGFKYANNNNYEVIVLMDADGQHDAKDIQVLVKTLENNYADIVIGSRLIDKNDYHITFLRKCGINIFSYVTWIITKIRIRDITSGFQVFNRKAVEFLANSYPIDFPDAEVIISLYFAGIRVIEAPARFRQRLSGISMHSKLKSIYYPFKVIIAIIAILIRIYYERRR